MREAQPVWPFRGPPPAGLALFAGLIVVLIFNAFI